MLLRELKNSLNFIPEIMCRMQKMLVTMPLQKNQISNSIKGLYTQFFYKVSEIPDSIFADAAPANNLFLQKNYRQALEIAAPAGIQACYLVFFKQNQAVGIAAMQIKDFNAQESLRKTQIVGTWCEKLSNFVKQSLAKHVRFNTLVLGNLLLCGEHGYWFQPTVTDGERNIFIKEGLEIAKEYLLKAGTYISAVFVKDFFETNRPVLFETDGYNPFQVEPNLVFDLPENWLKYDDYLNALSSKYRVRAKRAFKKAESLDRKVFNEERIQAYLPRLNELYQNIADAADFNMVSLHPEHQLAQKRTLGENFQLIGYFVDNQLIAFFTTVKNYDETEACFLGYDKNFNHEYQIYLNILFDIVRIGIENRSKRIIFARTASEIKTTVGAQAREMYLYLKHQNPLVNKILPKTLPMLSPRIVWEARHPFKE
jgi:hypothetical protein